MDLPADDELMTAMTEAGWLLEQSAVRTLESMGQHPRSGWAFADPDQPSTSREIDVWTYYRAHEAGLGGVNVNVSFLVECKQSRNPYAAIGRTLEDWHFFDNPVSHYLNGRDHISVPWSERMVSAWRGLGFADIEAQYGFDSFRASQITRLDRGKGGRWQADNAGIFTSLVMPLAKAVAATKKDHDSRFPEIRLLFPTVITSSPILTIDASSEDPTSVDRNWVTVRRMLDTPHTRGYFEFHLVEEKKFPLLVQNCLDVARQIGTHQPDWNSV